MAIGLLVCVCSIAIIHYSIWTVETTAMPEHSPEETRLIVDKVIEKIKAGDIPASDIEKILKSGREADEASYEISSGLISVQEGLLSIMEAMCILYLLSLLVYFLPRRT